MDSQHVVSNYMGFVQQIVRLATAGYSRYALTIYPERKRQQWSTIDEKIVGRYPMLGVSKYVRARRKARGILNGLFLRWGELALIFISDGVDDSGITESEQFQPLRDSPRIQIGDGLSLTIIQRNKRWTVALDKSCLRDVLAYYDELGRRADLSRAQREFSSLEKLLPSWSGLYAQKKLLRRQMVTAARRSGKRWSVTNFPLADKKRSYKVFCAEAPIGASI